MPPTPRIRPYKDFLTPALHRRFAMATATLFGLCYVEAVLIGEKNSFFWSWFPLSTVGIRTGLLFIPSFVIFILRVGQLHVGLRTSYSGWDTFKRYAVKLQVLHTLGWYLASAWFFGEVFIWSASPGQDMYRIKKIPRTDRTTLNEKPIYLASFLLFLAVVQACFHLWYDYDRIDMPAPKTKSQGLDGASQDTITAPGTQLRNKLPSIAFSAAKRSFAATVFGPIFYSLNLGILPSVRRVMWGVARFYTGIFYTLPKSSSLPGTRPFHLDVLKNTWISGFFLVMLWEVGNAAFSIYVAQEPLKNDRPITYESRDPNGSLLTGLKGKKLQTRAFAFWELVYIAERFEGRRKAIFEDIDRNGGSTWSQILGVCLEVINGIETRIADYERPPGTAAPDPTKILEPPIQGLPRLAQPLKNGLKEPGDLFTKEKKSSSMGPRAAVAEIGNYVKNHGQSPPGPLSARARKPVAEAVKLLTPKEKADAENAGFGGVFKEYALRFLKWPVGEPFRQEYRRKINAIVLGQPFGDVGIIVDAINAVTRFSVCSLKEDRFGNVQRDVKLIIRTLTATVMRLEAFKMKLGFHWTDVEKKQECPEVDAVVDALKSGLNDLVNSFGGYSEDLRLSQSEMRMARLAATPAPKKTEMTTVT